MTTLRSIRPIVLAAAVALTASPAMAQAPGKLKVGLMLPATGTFAALGTAIENGFKLYVTEQGGKLGGREIEYVKVDDESDPAKAVDNVNKLIKRDNVDVLIGTVHSGVAMAMAKAAKESGTLLIVPNAGADAVTGPMCAVNIFRSSFCNWQPGYAMGEVLAKKGLKNVVTITWKYAAGDESVKGFKEAFEKGGGKVTKELNLPFPNVEFQALLTEIAAAKPDAVFAFFAGGGAVKFVKDYAGAGLRKTIPLYGSGFLTDGTLEAQGADAEGLQTTLHYADALGTPKDTAFRAAYEQGVQDAAGRVRGPGLRRRADAGHRPRGDQGRRRARRPTSRRPCARRRSTARAAAFTMSASHNPVQDFYLRKVTGQGEQVHQHRQQGAGRPGARLPHVTADQGLASSTSTHGLRAFARGPLGALMDLTTFLIQCLNAVQYGLLLFLVASGLTLIFGIMGVINLAHGSFYMIGAYMAYSLSPIVATTFGGGFFSVLVVGLVLAVVLGYVLEWAFYSYLYDREHLQQVLMTYGLILVFEELRSLLVGDDVYGVKPPEILAGALPLGDVMTYPVYRLFISAVCIALAIGMYIVFTRTRLGMMIRAGATNREMVQSLGIDIKFLYRVVFAAGVAIAALAGMVAAPVSSVYPGMGNLVLIICFVVVVIGGIGSIKGALVASLLIGVVDTFGKALMPQISGVLVYLLMAVILLWKPDGLFKAG